MESKNLTEKLNNFTSLVLKDAQEKRGEILHNIEKEYSEKLDEKETELLQNAYENIQQCIRDAKKEANARVLHSELESKKRLILRREEIIDEVMSSAEKKLHEFAQSNEYEEWLVSTIEKALFEVGKGSKTVYISPEDIKYRERIAKIPEMSRLTIEASGEKNFIGGAKVLNTDRKVSVDYSFREMLSDQKQKFLQESGLTLG